MNITMNESLSELLGLKGKSVLRSVFITTNKTYEGYYMIEVEAYDQTFLNATVYPSLQDKTYDYITRSIKKNWELIEEHIGDSFDRLWIKHYSTFDTHMEDLISK